MDSKYVCKKHLTLTGSIFYGAASFIVLITVLYFCMLIEMILDVFIWGDLADYIINSAIIILVYLTLITPLAVFFITRFLEIEIISSENIVCYNIFFCNKRIIYRVYDGVDLTRLNIKISGYETDSYNTVFLIEERENYDRVIVGAALSDLFFLDVEDMRVLCPTIRIAK